MSMKLRFRALAALVFALAGSTAVGATFHVTRGDDPPPNGCLPDDCSLREAIVDTATTPEADTITLGAGQFQVWNSELVITRAITIRGAGSDATRIISIDDFPILHVVPFGELTLEGLEISSSDGVAMVVTDNGTATLRDVHIPGGFSGVGTESSSSGAPSGSLRIEDSSIESFVVCYQTDGVCRLFDSDTRFVLAHGELELKRVVIDGDGTDLFGLSLQSMQPATIEDSTIRNSGRPFYVRAASNDVAPPIHVRRTRFVDNFGPLVSDRASYIHMDDVEFRDNVVSDAHVADPAVLLAGPGPAWFISRALVVGNRGGNTLDGAVIRVLGGGRAIFDNTTFDDNTFRDAPIFGHTIGVYNSTATPALLWLIHATMRRALTLDEATVGSLLTVRGPNTDVRLGNTALHGTCAFSGGGAIVQGIGNAEASDTCGLDEATNLVGLDPSELGLGDLADHGGFTDSFYPTRVSHLVDAADPAFCGFVGPLDQRAYVRPLDGIDCDIGAVEIDAVSDSIFADGLEG
jgi:hypothetical protein